MMFSGRIRVYDEQTREISLLQRSGASIRQAPQTVYTMQANMEHSAEKTGKKTASTRTNSFSKYSERERNGN